MVPRMTIQRQLTTPRFAKTTVFWMTAVACAAGTFAGCDDEEDGSIAQQASGASTAPKLPSEFDQPEAPEQLAQPEIPTEPQGELPETELELLSPGKAPHAELRYKFEAGRKHEMVMDMQMDMRMTMNGTQAPAVSMPKIRTRVTLEEEKVLDNGNVRSKAVIRDMRVLDEKSADPAVLASLKPELARVENLEGWSEMTSRGFIVGGEYTTPPGATPQLKQMVQQLQGNMKQLSFPLPEKPVGQGAKWRVIQAVRNSGMTIDQTSTCTLKSHKGSEAKLNCAIAQDAKVQTLREGLPAGAVGKLLSHKASGDSEIELNLNKLVPNSKGEIKATTEMSLSTGGRNMMMKTQMTMNMEVMRK